MLGFLSTYEFVQMMTPSCSLLSFYGNVHFMLCSDDLKLTFTLCMEINLFLVTLDITLNGAMKISVVSEVHFGFSSPEPKVHR